MEKLTGTRLYLPILFTAFLAISLISGCKKEPTFLANVRIANSVKGYQFAPGSYWVYELASDTIEDSVYILKAETGSFQFEAEENEEEIWDFYKMEYGSSHQDEGFFEVISRDEIRRGAGDVDSTREGGELRFAGDAIPKELRYTTDNWTLEAEGDVENLQAGNLLWPTAKSFIVYDPNNPINGRDKLYYVAEVGLVRIEKDIADTTAQTWNLARYRAIPAN